MGGSASNGFVSALLRRRLLVAVALVATAVVSVLMWVIVPPTYSATASAVLLPPEAAQQGTRNPYLYLGGLEQARDIAIRVLASKDVQDEVASAHPGVEYTVTEDPMSPGPLLIITAEGQSAEAAVATMADLLARVPETLANLQNELDIADRDQIRTLALTEDNEPKVLRKSQIRAVIVAAGGCLGVGLLAIGFLDGPLSRRRQRRSGDSPPESEEPSPRPFRLARRSDDEGGSEPLGGARTEQAQRR